MKMISRRKFFVFIYFLILCASIVIKGNAEAVEGTIKAQTFKTYLNQPLQFVKNEGQINESFKYFEKGAGHSIFFANDSIHLLLLKDKEPHAIKLTPVNGNECPDIIGEKVSLAK